MRETMICRIGSKNRFFSFFDVSFSLRGFCEFRENPLPLTKGRKDDYQTGFVLCEFSTCVKASNFRLRICYASGNFRLKKKRSDKTMAIAMQDLSFPCLGMERKFRRGMIIEQTDQISRFLL